MLKRLILSIVLLILCFGIGFGSYYYIEKTAENFSLEFEEAFDLIQEKQYDKATEKLSEIEENWDKTENWYNIFLDYSLFEELEINIPLIKNLVGSESYDYASTKLLEIIETFNSIIHEQKISIGNVLVVY